MNQEDIPEFFVKMYREGVRTVTLSEEVRDALIEWRMKNSDLPPDYPTFMKIRITNFNAPLS